jgi:hypothetical protein
VTASHHFGDIGHGSLAWWAPEGFQRARNLIAQIARENFLWDAPRIQSELLMLGFSVPQATVSRYLPARSKRPWRTP